LVNVRADADTIEFNFYPDFFTLSVLRRTTEHSNPLLLELFRLIVTEYYVNLARLCEQNSMTMCARVFYQVRSRVYILSL